MGLLKWSSDADNVFARVQRRGEAMRAVRHNRFGVVEIADDEVRTRKTGEGGPVAGAHATVETSGELSRRITATRLATTGVFALALKKKRGERQLSLTVTGTGFEFVVELDPDKQADARRFAARLNTAAQGG